MSHQTMKIRASYHKGDAVCTNRTQLESFLQRRVPDEVIHVVLEHGAKVNWQGINLNRELDPPNHISDTPEYQREQVAFEAKRQLLQE